MEPSYLTPFSKATLTGVFVGFVTTVLCLAYNIFFRERTGFPLSDFINVSSLIFAVNLIFLVLGMLFYFFLRLSRRGDVIYFVFMLLVTGVLSFLAAGIHRSDTPILNSEFRELFLPIVITMGLAAAIGIPLLYRNRKFEEHVL
jgi:hypothetical protein